MIRKYIFWVCFLPVSVFCCNLGPPARAGESRRLTADAVRYIESFVEKQMDKNLIPGVGVGLVEGNEIVLAKGYGVKSVDTHERVDPDTLFHIGSVNKSFTSMLAACLVDARVIDWDSTIHEMCPVWQLKDEALKFVTVFELLSMTSGILADDEDDFWDDFGDNAVPMNIASFFTGFKLSKSPGEKFSYSNLAVSLGGYLFVYVAARIDKPLNEGYSDLLRQYVLVPMGMNDSTVFISEARAYGNMAAPHKKIQNRVVLAGSEDRDDDPLAPSGSIKSSANDMNKFLMTQLREGVAPDGTRVVSSKNLTKTWTPTRLSLEERYGMGWESRTVDGTRVVSHEGVYDNFTSIVILLPEKNVGMVILANTEYVGSLLSQAHKILIKAVDKFTHAIHRF